MTISFATQFADTRSASGQHADSAVSVDQQQATAAVGQLAHDRIEDDGLTFGGTWTDEVLERSGAYFDVPAAAVRRRTRGN